MLVVFMVIPFGNWVYGQESDKEVFDISYEGNKTYPPLVLNSYIYTSSISIIERIFGTKKTSIYLNRDEIRRDEIRLMRFYERRGFPFAQVNAEIRAIDGKNAVKIIFQVQEGKAQRISSFSLQLNASHSDSLVIVNNDAFKSALKKHAYREGRRYESILESDVQLSLTEPLKRIGYPFASLKMEYTFSDDRSTVAITATIESGKRSRITQFNVAGTNSLSKAYILREASIKKNSYFDKRAISNAQRELFDHHLIRFATIGVNKGETDSTVQVQFNIREQALRTLQLTGGIGIEETVRGQVVWTHRNVFDKAHQVNAETALSFIEQRFSVSYLIPWMFNTRSSLVISPFAQNLLEPSFTLLRAGVNNTFIYRSSRNFTSTVAYNMTRNQERLKNRNSFLPDSIQSFDISSINTGFLYNKGYVKDQNGWVIRGGAEVSGTIMSATYPFEKVNLDVRHYKPAPWRGGQLAFKSEVGLLISTVSQDSLPRNIRFFLGGTSSVRGWNRQMLGPKEALFDGDRFQSFVPRGGRSLLAFSVEFRQDIPFFFKGFGLATFLDGGNIWSGGIDLANEPLRLGTGIGVRYQSPIGPLRLDFGYKINPSDADLGFLDGVRYQDPSRWAIHFSLGQAF